jgi:hypothetical protein
MNALLPLFLWMAVEPPTPADLVRNAITARERQQGWQFTWREDVEQRREGQPPEITTYEVIMLEGETYRKKVLVDGQPLSAQEQARVDADLNKTRDQRRKRSLRRITRTVQLGGLDELSRLFDLSPARAETVASRPAWRVEATPKPGVKPRDKKEESALNTRRTIWFDQAEGVELMRLDHFLRATNGFQPGSEIEMQFGKVGEAWVIERLLLRYHLKAMARMNARGETHHRFYNYQRFTAESTLLPQ